MKDNFEQLEAELSALLPVQPDERHLQEIRSRMTPEAARLDALEEELMLLLPSLPSKHLATAIGQQMSPAATRRRRPGATLVLLALAAAAAAVLVLVRPPVAPELPLPATDGATVVADGVVAAAPMDSTAPAAAPATFSRRPPLAFADPRADALLAAGYRPVSFGQVVLNAHDEGPIPGHPSDAHQMRVKVQQDIGWRHADTGVRVNTSQVNEAVIRESAAFY